MAKIENAGINGQFEVIRVVNPTVSKKDFFRLVKEGKTMEQIVTELKPVAIIFFDIAKAFDSVPRMAILEAMRLQGHSETDIAL